jgi:surface polysaccharide O-acyltransferase-like enzyme
MFWNFREPFFTFYFGYFLMGWLIAHHIRWLQPLFEGAARLVWPVLLVGAAVYVTAKAQAILNDGGFGRRSHLYRIPYTLCATGLITTFTRTRYVPAVIQFLSEASLTIYLYHFLFQVALLPHTLTWSPVPRVLAILLVGLLGSSAIAIAGRRILGGRSRILLGY